MNSNMIFDAGRFIQLIRSEIQLRLKNILIAAIVIILFLALLPFHMTAYSGMYFIILFASGFIVTSMSFRELSDPARAHWFLMLPCSTLERFFSKWFSTSVLFALALLAIYYLFSWFSYAINFIFFHQQINVLHITDSQLWSGISKYLILHSIFFFGAILFHRYNFLKTIACIILGFFIYGWLSFFITWVFCPTCVVHRFIYEYSASHDQFIFWIILSPICLSLAYLKLARYELK